MPYKDQDKQREYQRKYQREYQRMKRAAGNNSGFKVLTEDLTPEGLQTATSLLKLLGDTLYEVKSTQGDTFQKARVLGYLVRIGLKAVETADIERRLVELEEQSKGSAFNGH